jgi:hypothetical protein
MMVLIVKAVKLNIFPTKSTLLKVNTPLKRGKLQQFETDENKKPEKKCFFFSVVAVLLTLGALLPEVHLFRWPVILIRKCKNK